MRDVPLMKSSMAADPASNATPTTARIRITEAWLPRMALSGVTSQASIPAPGISAAWSGASESDTLRPPVDSRRACAAPERDPAW